MQRKLYKSLDKPSSLLGIQGSYQRYAIAGIAVCGIVAVVIGRLTVGLIGGLSFAAMAAAVYLAVMRYQSRYSERERDKKIASTGLPEWLVMPNHRLSRESSVVFRRKDS